MRYRRLGSTDVTVSVVGVGTWQLGGEWGRRFRAEEVRDLLARARERGVNLIDTAECYGDHVSESLIGEAVAGERGRPRARLRRAPPGGRRLSRRNGTDAVVAGLVAAIVSGVPSTTWTLVRGGDLTEGVKAAGALLLPHERRPRVLMAAAVPVHLTLSLGWAALLARVMPTRHEMLWGALAGLAVALLDLAVIGRHIAAIRTLDQPPQWADHVAFGVAVGAVLRALRR